MEHIAIVCLNRETALEAVIDLMAERNSSKTKTMLKTDGSIEIEFENGDSIIWLNHPDKLKGRKFTRCIVEYDTVLIRDYTLDRIIEDMPDHWIDTEEE